MVQWLPHGHELGINAISTMNRDYSHTKTHTSLIYFILHTMNVSLFLK